jgi:hypothetical protein
MSKYTALLKKLNRKFLQIRYTRTVQGVFATPPVKLGNMPFTLLSMVHTKDVAAYLVAVKTFTKYANPHKVVVVCDPTLTAADRATLVSHIPHIELRNASEFTHEDIPRGGTWERLFAISEYSTNDYVVQLDADTITARSPVEVIQAIYSNRGFVLGETPNQTLMTTVETAEKAKALFSTGVKHIQCLVEASMAGNGLYSNAYYVRGCSGFTGFPKSDCMRVDLLKFSKTMKAVHRERWSDWGTEQTTSNYLIANMIGTQILPFPLYGTPDVSDGSSTLVHYIGYLRFLNNKYQKDTQRAISLLNEEFQIVDDMRPHESFN